MCGAPGIALPCATSWLTQSPVVDAYELAARGQILANKQDPKSAELMPCQVLDFELEMVGSCLSFCFQLP